MVQTSADVRKIHVMRTLRIPFRALLLFIFPGETGHASI
jgi:hypothetical protein